LSLDASFAMQTDGLKGPFTPAKCAALAAGNACDGGYTYLGGCNNKFVLPIGGATPKEVRASIATFVIMPFLPQNFDNVENGIKQD